MRYRITGTIGNFTVDLTATPEDATAPPLPPDPDLVTFERPGIFHVATAAAPQLRIEEGITPPPGVYSEARIEFDFYFAGFNPSAPNGRHSVCWFVLDGNGALLFYPLVVRKTFRVGHGVYDDVGVPKHGVERPFPGETGWYHVAAAYGNGDLAVNMRSEFSSVAFTDPADVSRLVVEPGSQFLLHFGFHGKEGPEFPDPRKEPISLGWVWRNLRISYRPEAS